MCRIGVAVWILLVIALAGLPAGVQAQGDDDGLVAEWHFDEGAGSVLVDSSGNGNDGVIHGATWVEGKYGKALQFDGVDGYVGLPRIFMNTPPQISVEGWFKTTSDSQMMFFSFGGYYAMYVRAWRSDPSGALLPLFDGSSRGDVSWGRGYNDGHWHHFVAVNDGSKTTLYVDGFIINSRSETLFDISSINEPYVIGSQIIGAPETNRFDGVIDEVRIYNRALTAEEIKQHYEGTQTALSLTKSASPHSIKHGQTTTVTLTVTNTGTTEITDIEVSDTIPTDLTFTSGETSKRYDSLRPKDSREFQYTIQPSDVGTFNLDPAKATYADEEKNYYTSKSSTVAIEVIPSTGTTPAQVMSTHHAATALSITKSPSLNSIRQFGETVITLSIKNSGTTDVTDIEITDAIHPSFDLTSGDFPNPKRYDLIRPGETRDLQYTIKALEGGTFTLDHATITYADADGNIQEAESEPYVIRVVPSASGSAAGASHHPSSISTASVHLHGEKTDVVMGEDILLKLSAVNKITKPTMTLQVILIPPSGMSVTSADFVESGAGLYTSTYVIEPGIGRDIEVGIRSNQVGEFVVNGEVIYYFGDDKENAEEHLLSLPITVRASPDSQQDAPVPTATSKDGKGVPGFEVTCGLLGSE